MDGSELSIEGIERLDSSARTSDVDLNILNALRSEDRSYVLNLGELMEGLISKRQAQMDVTPETSYQRFLVVLCSAYYKLSCEGNPETRSITIVSAPHSKIPTRRLCELVPAEAVAQDVEPSESGSLGGYRDVTRTSRKPITINEREAAYTEARSRIFRNFQEKDEDTKMFSWTMSAGGGGSTVNVLDGSSPRTVESEWYDPVTNAKEEGRLGSSSSSGSPPWPQRPLRADAPPFIPKGSTCSRELPSPEFKYASIYDPSTSTTPYDSSQISGKLRSTAYHSMYLPPAQAPPRGYPTPCQYYALDSYPLLPQQNWPPIPHPPSPSVSDPHSHSYLQPFQYAAHPYMNPYIWSYPDQTSPPLTQHLQLSQPFQAVLYTAAPRTTLQRHNTLSASAPYPPHPAQEYYLPLSSSPRQRAIPPSSPQPYLGSSFSTGVPQIMNGDNDDNTSAAGVSGWSKRSAMHQIRRTSWSYGPGVGTKSRSQGGLVAGEDADLSDIEPSESGSLEGCSNATGTRKKRMTIEEREAAYNEARARLFMGFEETITKIEKDKTLGHVSSTRRTLGRGNANARNRILAPDEISLSGSSSTLSSSRWSVMSTTSSSRFLPPRPDWAVGLKPQPSKPKSSTEQQPVPNSGYPTPVAYTGPPSQGSRDFFSKSKDTDARFSSFNNVQGHQVWNYVQAAAGDHDNKYVSAQSIPQTMAAFGGLGLGVASLATHSSHTHEVQDLGFDQHHIAVASALLPSLALVYMFLMKYMHPNA